MENRAKEIIKWLILVRSLLREEALNQMKGGENENKEEGKDCAHPFKP